VQQAVGVVPIKERRLTRPTGDLTGCGQRANSKESPTLEEYKRAIETSGFLLEVRVGNLIRDLGYLMTPNSPIPHPEQRTELIEVDVEASRADLVPGAGFSETRLTLLIECKLNSQPIAFFSQPQDCPEANAYRVAYCADPVTDSEGSSSLVEFMCVEKWHHYARATTVATQLCSFTTNKTGKITTDPCSKYRESLNRLCLATAARALRLKGRSAQDRDPRFGFFIELVYPILVAGGPIMSVIPNAGGVRLLSQEHIQLHRGARVDGTLHEFQIDVVTEAALSTLLATIQAEAELLAKWAEYERQVLLPQAPDTQSANRTTPSKRVAGVRTTKSLKGSKK
jgi:hypothetical protein